MLPSYPHGVAPVKMEIVIVDLVVRVPLKELGMLAAWSVLVEEQAVSVGSKIQCMDYADMNKHMECPALPAWGVSSTLGELFSTLTTVW